MRFMRKTEKVKIAIKTENKELIENMKMTYQPDAQAAVDYAIYKLRKNGVERPTIGVIPNGVSIICN